MERFCGHIQRATHSRRFPWAEMANYVEHRAQLRIISMVYDQGVLGPIYTTAALSKHHREARVSLSLKRQPGSYRTLRLLRTGMNEAGHIA